MDYSTKSLLDKSYVQYFRHSAPYINAHRDKTFVIMLPGEAILHENFQSIIHDLTLLHSLGIRLVLVHGARPQINQNLQQANASVTFHHQHRITPRESLPYLLNAIGATRLSIEALLSMGLINSPMYGAKINVVSGNYVTAKPYGVRDGIDFQLAGEIRWIDNQNIEKHLNNHSIVLISPLGYSSTGEIFNVLAEEVASKTAIALKADKLILMTEYQGLFDQNNQLQRELHPSQLTDYIADQQENFQLHSLLTHAQTASESGVQRVHILPYQYDGALVEELFSRDGLGTMITNAHYEQVRTATIDDIGGLIKLLRPLEEKGILVYRSRERLEQEIDLFAVIERDGMILACAALYPIPTQNNEPLSAEIACVAVDPNYRKSNRGAQILEFLQTQAQQQNIQQLFALTTQTAHWFIEHGFEICPVNDLPQARQALYNYQRNSLVLKKLLNSEKAK